MMYFPHATEPGIIYVFATKGGAPANPDWYYNLTVAGDGSVERGTETYKVTVGELTGSQRAASTARKRSATRASPSTHARPLESARFPCLNFGGHSPAARSAARSGEGPVVPAPDGAYLVSPGDSSRISRARCTAVERS
jgi:F420H(2)-dependent quinone reductase